MTRPGRSDTPLESYRAHSITSGLSFIEEPPQLPAGPARYEWLHIAGSVEEMVGRMAAAVAPGGTLLLVGYRPVDPVTGEPTPAAGQVQVSLDTVIPALDGDHWKVIVAEKRPRAVAHSGVDAVIRARRRA